MISINVIVIGTVFGLLVVFCIIYRVLDKETLFYLPNWPFIVGVVLCVVFGLMLAGFQLKKREVNVSNDVTLLPAKELVQMDDYYLFQDGSEIQYTYINNEGALETDKVEFEKSHATYQKEASHMITRQTVQIYYEEWLFIRSSEKERITYEYEFYVPNRDYIHLAFEN